MSAPASYQAKRRAAELIPTPGRIEGSARIRPPPCVCVRIACALFATGSRARLPRRQRDIGDVRLTSPPPPPHPTKQPSRNKTSPHSPPQPPSPKAQPPNEGPHARPTPPGGPHHKKRTNTEPQSARAPTRPGRPAPGAERQPKPGTRRREGPTRQMQHGEGRGRETTTHTARSPPTKRRPEPAEIHARSGGETEPRSQETITRSSGEAGPARRAGASAPPQRHRQTRNRKNHPRKEMRARQRNAASPKWAPQHRRSTQARTPRAARAPEPTPRKRHQPQPPPDPTQRPSPHPPAGQRHIRREERLKAPSQGAQEGRNRKPKRRREKAKTEKEAHASRANAGLRGPDTHAQHKGAAPPQTIDTTQPPNHPKTPHSGRSLNVRAAMIGEGAPPDPTSTATPHHETNHPPIHHPPRPRARKRIIAAATRRPIAIPPKKIMSIPTQPLVRPKHNGRAHQAMVLRRRRCDLLRAPLAKENVPPVTTDGGPTHLRTLTVRSRPATTAATRYRRRSGRSPARPLLSDSSRPVCAISGHFPKAWRTAKLVRTRDRHRIGISMTGRWWRV